MLVCLNSRYLNSAITKSHNLVTAQSNCLRTTISTINHLNNCVICTLQRHFDAGTNLTCYAEDTRTSLWICRISICDINDRSSRINSIYCDRVTLRHYKSVAIQVLNRAKNTNNQRHITGIISLNPEYRLNACLSLNTIKLNRWISRRRCIRNILCCISGRAVSTILRWNKLALFNTGRCRCRCDISRVIKHLCIQLRICQQGAASDKNVSGNN